MTPIFRFAPSPNGELHLGHALSALVGFEMARRVGGRFLLRIEDIDIGRCREVFIDGILGDLHWLGVRWEEPVLRQSRHLTDYASAVTHLIELGLLYPCFASRMDIASAAAAVHPADSDPEGVPLYPFLHKSLSTEEVARRRQRGEPFALRLDMDRAMVELRRRLGNEPLTFREMDSDGRTADVTAHPERWGDCVIVRKDVPTSYHLAVTFDDVRQGVTHVTRGRDLYAATDVQRLLQALLEWPEPLYHHHRLITDTSGRKLSKSAGDTSLARLRAAGHTPADIRRLIGL
ncbi:MAG: tRNA glutamyl-Q(34) synthetase GluQRS [Hyphomicrobium sp.]